MVDGFHPRGEGGEHRVGLGGGAGAVGAAFAQGFGVEGGEAGEDPQADVLDGGVVGDVEGGDGIGDGADIADEGILPGIRVGQAIHDAHQRLDDAGDEVVAGDALGGLQAVIEHRLHFGQVAG